MSNIEELENRIAAAMDRIATGVSKLGVGGDESAALEEEKLANAQLTERVRKLSEKLEAAQSASNGVADKIAALDLEMQRLRQANEQLRKANAALREANEAGVAEPHLINKAMLAELEALRAARAADAAEADTILDALDRIISQAETAGENANA